MCQRTSVRIFACLALFGVIFVGYSLLWPEAQSPLTTNPKTPELFNSCDFCDLKMNSGLKYVQPNTQIGRTDVNAVTNWNAPLVWEGTFDPVVVDGIYKNMNPGIAVLVLAVGKYTRFLKGFLESGEKYFFVGFRVTFYIFTDNKKKVPEWIGASFVLALLIT